MLKALYYPHTDIQSPIIIKNALLLWDSIETIVPRANWQRVRFKGTGDRLNQRRIESNINNTNKVLKEATELIVKRRVPSLAERQTAHTTLSEIVKSGLATTLIVKSPREWRRPEYLIYPEKFLEETWHLLEKGGMARWENHASDYGVPAALGFLMMSTLADSCAGTQIQRVTDRVDAYSWIAQHRASVLGSPYVTGLDISHVAPNLDRLVTITCEVLDARDISLKKLLEFRKREIKSGSADYSALRRRYSSLLQQHLDRIGKEAKTGKDVRELEDQFKVEIKQDLADLKAELKVASWKTLFSKEVALSAAIVAGCLVAPVAGLTALATHLGGIGVIPLVKGEIEYREARRKALRQHPMSWLYLHRQKLLTPY
jgi:hypothetical protein